MDAYDHKGKHIPTSQDNVKVMVTSTGNNPALVMQLSKQIVGKIQS